MMSLICSQVESVRNAEEKGVAVHHLLLDNVRACSSTPDAAAAFFCAVLHPSPTARLTSAQALQHPYLRRCVAQMQASYHASPAPASAVMSNSSPLQGTDILGRLASVSSSGLKMMKSLVSQALPGTSSSGKRHKVHMRDMARYFPDYSHPSSDAELSAYQACTPTDAALPPVEAFTDVRPLMAGMNQLRTAFDLGPAVVAPSPPMAATMPWLPPIMHAKASPGTDFAAAALQLQRQLYPASPLSAGSGFIPAIYSARAQPFGPFEGVVDAALGQEHSLTPGQEAVESNHVPPSSHVDEPQTGSTQASYSTLHMTEAVAHSAQDYAAAAADSAAQPPAAVSGAPKEEEDRLHLQEIGSLPGGTDQAVVEQKHSEMQEMLMTEPAAELASCLLAADIDAAGKSGNRATAVSKSRPVSQESLVSHDTHKDQCVLRSHPIHTEPEDEEEVADAQPSQSLQSLSVNIPDQLHGQLPNQHLGASPSGKSLRSHALQFHAGSDEGLDEPDPSDEDKSGSGSHCSCPGMKDADIAPDPNPYLNEDVPLQQAQKPQDPHYRSVATAAYLTCSPCLALQNMLKQAL